MRVLSLLAVLLLLSARTVSAFTPSLGVWWNPNESGRGYLIDVQNGVMVVSVYAYDSGGTPLWFLGAGPYDDATSTFTVTMNTFTGGQCFGCGFSSPTPDPAGTFQIVFTDLETAVLHFPGGSTNLQHFAYGYSTKQDYLLGLWSFSEHIGTDVFSTQWINFNSHYTSTDGTVYVSGVGENSSSTVALGSYNAASGNFIVIIIDSVDYSHTYILVGDDRRMLGTGELEPPNVNPTGNGLFAAATRIADSSELSSNVSFVHLAKAAAPASRLLRSAEAVMRAASLPANSN
jgi:hypothetical protein